MLYNAYGYTNIVRRKCSQGKVFVLLLTITNLKAMNTSLNPFNLLYARYPMAANLFLLFNSRVVRLKQKLHTQYLWNPHIVMLSDF